MNVTLRLSMLEGVRLSPEQIDLARNALLAHPHHHQNDGEAQERQKVPPQRSFHARPHPPAIADAEHRTRMLIAIPLDRLPHDIGVHCSEYAHNSGEPRS